MIKLRHTFVLGVAMFAAVGLSGSQPAAIAARPHQSPMKAVDSATTAPVSAGDAACRTGSTDSGTDPDAAPNAAGTAPAGAGTAVSLTVLPAPSQAGAATEPGSSEAC